MIPLVSFSYPISKHKLSDIKSTLSFVQFLRMVYYPYHIQQVAQLSQRECTAG